MLNSLPMAVLLNQIVPWGRTFDEYVRMFDLRTADLQNGVLDCGGGPAGFTAELFARGIRAVSADPLYACSGAEIRAQFEAVAEPMLQQVRATPDDWVWTYHRNPEELLLNRRAALERFLADYEEGRRQGRYIVAELPELPFADAEFGLVVCSHLLFLYSGLLSLDFHSRAIMELCRVASEVRIFPLLKLQREPSEFLPSVCERLGTAGLASEIVSVNYEFQRGGNQMLKLFRPGRSSVQ